MFNLDFEILFTVEILHRYYQDEVCNDFIITPSQKTQDVLNGYKMIWKQYANRLYVGMQSDPSSASSIPLIEISDDLQLTFFMTCKNPLFYNYTNLPQNAGQSHILYFSNKKDNIGQGKKLLSNAMKVFNGTISYVPGDIILSGDDVYESISLNPSTSITPSNDIGVPGFWRMIDNNRYATADDMLPPDPSVALEINGTNICGVIEIFNDVAVPANYKLLDTNKIFLSPLYTIYFLNRSVRWKYFFRDADFKTITDTANNYTFNTISPNVVSDVPIPLNDMSLKFKLASSGVDIASPIPCASAKSVVRGTDHFYYSEIYLNY